MTNKQLLLALGELDEFTVTAAHAPMRRDKRRPLRVALIAATAAVLCLSVAWGVTAAINSQRARFAQTREEWRDNFPGEGFSYLYDMDEKAAFGSADEREVSWVEVAQNLIDRSGEFEHISAPFYKRGEDGKLTETGGGYDWELIMQAESMPSLTAMNQYQNIYHPDVSYLESTLTPVEGAFLYCTMNGDGRIWGAGQENDPAIFTDQTYLLQVRGGYRTSSGGWFEMLMGFYPHALWSPSWFVGETITFRDVVKSADGTEFDVVQAGNTILADAIFRHGYVVIEGVDMTVDEVIDQITHLDLKDVPTVFSTGN